MKVTLRLIKGPETGRTFELKDADSFLVGRSRKAHLQLDKKADRLISRTHFLLEVRPPRCFVTDLDSRNGTYVNSHKITRADLKNGDLIRVGSTVIQVAVAEDRKDADGPLVCSVCGREAAESPPPDGSPENFICAECLRKEEEQRTQRTTVQTRPSPASTYGSTGIPNRITCLNCEADITGQANIDRLTSELIGAVYLCKKCAAKTRKKGLAVDRVGDYIMLDVVGQGGMGVVYKAFQLGTGRLCAVKMILPELAMNEYAARVFEREIQTQSEVLHPNLLRVLEQGRHDNTPYFVTEFMAGGDVQDLMAWEFSGPMDPALACRIAIQILLGLQSLHERGLIHRDLKPSNYLLDRSYKKKNFVAKIADYGLAKSFENAGNSLFDFTKEGLTAGSYKFIPPEQITNYKFVKPPVDIFAVGASLYFMLSGKYPYNFPTEAEREGGKARHPIEIILEDDPTPILERNPNIPPRLARIVDQAAAKDYRRRWGSAEEFRAALVQLFKKTGGSS
ncbi:MAG: FHA domain-containing serine/threonine-protein kinase [Pseudomonadota bacterium]